MGDWFQIVVDQEALPKEADVLARKICDWLFTMEIIQDKLQDCVLSEGSGMGYPPGENYRIVTCDDVHWDIRSLRTNGLVPIIGRTVFHSGQGGATVSCPECRQIEEETGVWISAVDEWYKGNAGILQCSNCKQSKPITEWKFDPAWGFGYLGFKFWNWPFLKTQFIEQIEQQLHHKVVVVRGKL